MPDKFEFTIIDRVLNMYHTMRIQNPVKDLRWSALEN